MTDFISIQQAMDKGSGKISIRGWVHRERKSKKLGFIVMRDSSNIIQCVFDRSKFEDRWGDVDKILIETSMEIFGEIKKDDRAPSGYEIQVDDFKIVHYAEPFPITKDQSPEFLLDNRHLWLRSRKLVAVMKIRSTVMHAIHKFFTEKEYFLFDPPILQPNQCEGGSTLFEVKYYKDKSYLAQTWQLYAEAAIFALEKVYDVAPTFRAEKSKTSRHLSEFWMAEMEAAWLRLEDVTEIAKEEIKFIISEVLVHNKAELKFLEVDSDKLKSMIKKDWPTITYTKALNMLKEKNKMDTEWGKDLRTIEEEELMKNYDTPVVVIEYPKEAMAFYKPVKKRVEDDKKSNEKNKEEKQDEAPGPVALCFDMLAPNGTEIVGGSERDTDIDEIIKYLKKEGEDPDNYKFYLDLRKYGSVPHSGYGVGVERVIMWICGLDNVKDSIAFPRTMLRKDP